jgi:methyl-accepting chemotaxis protein
MLSFRCLETGALSVLDCYKTKIIPCGIFGIIVCTIIVRNEVSHEAHRLHHVVKMMEKMADNNFDLHREPVQSRDDYGLLASAINTLVLSTRDLLKTIKNTAVESGERAEIMQEGAESTAAAITQIASTITQIRESVVNQSSGVEEATASIRQIEQSVRKLDSDVNEQVSSIAESTAAVDEMVANIRSVNEVLEKNSVAVGQLRNAAEDGQKSVKEAVTSSQSILEGSSSLLEATKIIQSIASQTNLLAMNAAIEAAHAGAMGQGFAVVADEVRSLASSSAKSARDIQEYIKEMVEKIDGGVEAIAIAGRSFREIAENVEQNNALIKTISSAMEEQKIGAAETLNTTTDMVNAVQAIKDLTEHESVRAASVRKMMKDVVSSSEAAVQLVNEGVQASQVMGTAIEQVVDSVESNRRAVNSMNDAVKKFKV